MIPPALRGPVLYALVWAFRSAAQRLSFTLWSSCLHVSSTSTSGRNARQHTRTGPDSRAACQAPHSRLRSCSIFGCVRCAGTDVPPHRCPFGCAARSCFMSATESIPSSTVIDHIHLHIISVRSSLTNAASYIPTNGAGVRHPREHHCCATSQLLFQCRIYAHSRIGPLGADHNHTAANGSVH
jgi:hypothetical protein